MTPSHAAARLLLLVALAAGWAMPAPAAMRDGGRSRIVEVVDADTVVLADGREVRMVGIQAPKLPLGRKGFRAWPLAAEARQALVDLALGADVRLAHGGQDRDRHGRVLAHLYDDRRDLWLQGWMLEQGWARVYTFPDNRALVDEMLAAERRARAARRGIWGHRFYAIRTPDSVGRDLNTFQVVRGCATQVAEAGNRLYVNFGADWRSDFTIAIDRRDYRRYDGFGWLRPGEPGPCLRVRGWVKPRNGPMIEVTHPEQIERLER
ncbi:MAG: thermonuclease family protein [Alphaproteobacteria bacterium]